MENTTILLIGIAIIIIMFSSFTLSYKSDEATVDVAPSTNISTPTSVLVSSQVEASTVGASNPDAPIYAVYNLPEKDPYMSQQFRDQIDMLRSRYYYFDEKMIQK